jgi:hypothetical protein
MIDDFFRNRIAMIKNNIVNTHAENNKDIIFFTNYFANYTLGFVKIGYPHSKNTPNYSSNMDR